MSAAIKLTVTVVAPDMDRLREAADFLAEGLIDQAKPLAENSRFEDATPSDYRIVVDRDWPGA